MKVPFAEIAEDGTRYDITDASWFPQQDLARLAPVSATLLLVRKAAGRVEIQGHLETTVELQCDRCLKPYGLRIDTSIDLILECPDEEHWKLREVACSAEDLDTVVLREPIADLDDVLRQQLYLALPFKQLCATGCKGLCSRCGADLNQGPCGCDPGENLSPFAVLAKLKK